ncbi:rRNA maturation RNase YbeY [Allofustis seminis]|uniref:rRNA maturation RNase YbeY n=1 Tax=Allofustis seminis TaxID=166939 RepID=UPI00037A10E4|nr:rRNA maturation RNase YbeY [Allofustis seminis]
MQVAFFDETNTITPSQEEMLYEILDLAAKKLELPENIELSLVIVSDEKIHQMNRDYRHKDAVTDVISFALDDDESDSELFEFEEIEADIPRLIGDIYISAAQTARQAKEFDQTFEQELLSLAVHGLLHLNGYDHQTDAEAQEMFGLQTSIIEEYYGE